VRLRRTLAALLLTGVVLLRPLPASALEASDFTQLVGYTVVASAKLRGDYYGVDPGRPIELDNGMAFALEARFSTFSYRPSAVVFARAPQKAATKEPTEYKLLVQDRIYDAKRIK
jgi:hypothetical protein